MSNANNLIFNFHTPPEKLPLVSKLTSFGISEPHMTPLLLPKKYFDVSKNKIFTDFNQLVRHMDEQVLIGCKLRGEPIVDYKKKPILTRFTIEGKGGVLLSIAVFGDPRALIKTMKSSSVFCLKATVSQWNGNLQLKNVELVDMAWVGKIMPIYPGKGDEDDKEDKFAKVKVKKKTLKPETVQGYMMNLVDDHLEGCSQWLKTNFNLKNNAEVSYFLEEMGSEHKTFETLFKSIHLPTSIEAGDHSKTILRRMSAFGMVKMAKETVSSSVVKASSVKIPKKLVDQLISELPSKIKITADQIDAINECIEDIKSNQPMRRLLTGDVGSGKSLPIALLAAAMARLDLNTTILIPTAPLAEQMRKDIAEWWPDVNPKLVSGDSKGPKTLPDSRILIGTTALNFRVPDDYPIALHMIDEQQKFSVDQRFNLARKNTNVLEASATPMPRSLGLYLYGDMPISTLRVTHVNNIRHTERLTSDEDKKRIVFDRIKASVAAGNKALIVYPLAEISVNEEDGTVNKEADKKSAEGAFSLWERHFPGRVRFVHGRMSDEEKLSAINALKSGEADILCSTTVVEVGLNVDNLREVLVIHPERLGASTLHQIRGRVARNGGEGWMTLYTPDPISEKSTARLNILINNTDGFKIALEDMKLRGVGDMKQSSEMQSGYLDGFIPNYPVRIEDIEYVVQLEENSAQNDEFAFRLS